MVGPVARCLLQSEDDRMKQGNSLRSGWLSFIGLMVALCLGGCGRADLGLPEPPPGMVDGGSVLPTCGDHKCSPEETTHSCSDDCKCGDGVCSSDESPSSCAKDCPITCGNG